MPFILNATAVPIPPVFSGSYNPAVSGPLTSHLFATGDTTTVPGGLNENGGRVDLTARFGGGGYGLVHGLDLTAGAGLVLNIAAGQAQINGPVTYAGGTANLTNTARNWIWLSQAGAITVVVTSLTPPAGAQCLLGSALTSGGTISSVDQSGVLYLKGGMLKRHTADVTTPGDTPPAQLQFWNFGGSAKVFFWNGLVYTDFSSISTPVSIANGGTGASTAPLARAALGAMYEFQFAVQPGGNYSISAANALASQWEFQDATGTPSTPWDLTVPSAANLISAGMVAGHAWIIRNDTLAALKLVHTGGGLDRFLPEQSQGWFFFDGAEIREVAQNYPQYAVLTGNNTFTYESQQMKALIDYDCGGTPRTLNLKANTDTQRGRLVVVRNDQSSAAMLTAKTTGADVDFDTVLIPGEMQPLVMQGDGVFSHMRPYQRVVSVVMADANLTVGQEATLAYILEVTSSVPLTAQRDLILPTVSSHCWYIVNLTTGAQAIQPKTAAGGGFVLANARGAYCYGDGTAIHRMTPDAPRTP